MLKYFIFLTTFVYIQFGFTQVIDSSSVVSDTISETFYIPTTQIPIDSLIAYGKTYLGLPYRTTTRAPWPLDCSGYVSMLYNHYGINIPHSSGGIAAITKTIPIHDAQPGDFIFFRGRNDKKNRIGHVALIIEANNGQLIMMHSTTSKGIITEPYPSAYYYNSRFVKVGRLISGL